MNLKNPLYLASVMSIVLMTACNRNQATTEAEVKVKVPVTVTSMKIKSMVDYMELTATSKFLNKSVISAHATGYVQKVFHDPGDNVTSGEELFTLQTKEAAALSNDSLNQLEFPGLIHVKAAIDGMIISVDHPEGDFVMEGQSLGTISVPSSLVFLLDAPYEATAYIKINSLCEVLLPGGDSVRATISSRLPSMSESPQTQQFIVDPVRIKDIPENLIAKIRIARKTVPAATVLPGKCILADEVMKHFWVMKLINDTTAVRVDVQTGLSERGLTEITFPVFSMDDLFLASGNYGLADTVNVRVAGKMIYE
jgi:hypothetical protein